MSVGLGQYRQGEILLLHLPGSRKKHVTVQSEALLVRLFAYQDVEGVLECEPAIS